MNEKVGNVLGNLRRMMIGVMIAAAAGFFIFMLANQVLAASVNVQAKTGDWIFPAAGTISDTFNTRGGMHKGLDVAGKYHEKIYSAAGGIVTRSYYSSTYGNVIFIQHSSGFETVYAHLSERLVRQGRHVEKGELVGYMGNTGDSTGIHLHFEVHIGNWTPDKRNAIDPFLVFGSGETGQLVSAKYHDPYGIITVSAHEKKQIYIVKPGDTLWKISAEKQMAIEQIKNLNHIESDVIYAGQQLVLAK